MEKKFIQRKGTRAQESPMVSTTAHPCAGCAARECYRWSMQLHLQFNHQV